MKVLVFQHTPDETPGSLGNWIRNHRYPNKVHHWYRDTSSPDFEHDLLIVMGGPMNVDQEAEYPWLKEEKIFLREWVKQGKYVLGICLGAQMLAQVLGAQVTKARLREIGFYPVHRTTATHPALQQWPSQCKVYHFHQDTFSLPPGCVSLMDSSACDTQAFALNDRTLGIQFHPEAMAPWIRLNARNVNAQIGEPYVQTPQDTNAEIAAVLPEMTRNFFAMMDDFVAPLRS